MPDGSIEWSSFLILSCPNVWGYERDGIWKPEEFLTRTHATWGRSDKEAKERGDAIRFTFFLGLRLMHYLGVRRIYLLGVDFQMNQERGYAFNQNCWPGKVRGNNRYYHLASPMCDELKPVFEKAGLEVFNCNRQSRLKTWPFVPFDEAVEDCRGVVPKEHTETKDQPYDLSGWYEKIEEDK
jgi:hypothetical protein